MLYRVVIEPQQRENQHIYLKIEQLHYLERVVRLNRGDRFLVMDGRGNCWLASLEGNQALIVENFTPPPNELPWSLTLVTAIVKGDGFSDIVRSCTELGVTRIIPTLTSRTLNQPSSNKVERWRKIALESVEQSERKILPQIITPMSFSEVLQRVVSPHSSNYICLARGDTPHLLQCLQQSSHTELIIATGPEGGWTTEEVSMAIAAGFQGVNLGKRILRAITAPIAAATLVAAVAES